MLLKEKIDHLTHLSDSQRAVLTYMYANPHEIVNMTKKEIAKVAYTSPATLIRLSKNLGYRGFEDLKKDFIKKQEYLNHSFHSIDANIPFHSNDNYIGIASKITTLMKETADDTLSLIEFQDLKEAVHLLMKAEKIYLSAMSSPFRNKIHNHMQPQLASNDYVIKVLSLRLSSGHPNPPGQLRRICQLSCFP